MSRLGSNTLIAIALLIAMQAFGAAAAFAESTTAPGASPTAVFAGGCFWGVEGVFEHVRGVREVLSGYAGGDAGTAHYDAVSGGRTGHAEAVQITFDPQEISYGELLQIFFSVAHDPTQLNRQGPDTGTQYRSAVFYADDTQRDIAARYIAELNESGTFRDAIVTRRGPSTEPSIPRRATIRTSSRRIRAIPTSCSTTCRKSAISRRDFRTSIEKVCNGSTPT